jgi:hypothetical protein
VDWIDPRADDGQGAGNRDDERDDDQIPEEHGAVERQPGDVALEQASGCVRVSHTPKFVQRKKKVDAAAAGRADQGMGRSRSRDVVAPVPSPMTSHADMVNRSIVLGP